MLPNRFADREHNRAVGVDRAPSFGVDRVDALVAVCGVSLAICAGGVYVEHFSPSPDRITSMRVCSRAQTSYNYANVGKPSVKVLNFYRARSWSNSN